MYVARASKSNRRMQKENHWILFVNRHQEPEPKSAFPRSEQKMVRIASFAMICSILQFFFLRLSISSLFIGKSLLLASFPMTIVETSSFLDYRGFGRTKSLTGQLELDRLSCMAFPPRFIVSIGCSILSRNRAMH